MLKECKTELVDESRSCTSKPQPHHVQPTSLCLEITQPSDGDGRCQLPHSLSTNVALRTGFVSLLEWYTVQGGATKLYLLHKYSCLYISWINEPINQLGENLWNSIFYLVLISTYTKLKLYSMITYVIWYQTKLFGYWFYMFAKCKR